MLQSYASKVYASDDIDHVSEDNDNSVLTDLMMNFSNIILPVQYML